MRSNYWRALKRCGNLHSAKAEEICGHGKMMLQQLTYNRLRLHLLFGNPACVAENTSQEKSLTEAVVYQP